MFDHIDYDVHDGVATLTLNRPDHLNVYSVAMKDEMIEALDRADGDDDVRAMIVTGAGKAFCAGMDLSPGPRTFAREDEDPEARLRDSGGELTLRMFRSTTPIIGAINGVAVGVGATMTLPMDVRIASERAKFGFVFAQRGIVLESCSSWFLPRLVGMGRATEWALTGRIAEAAEALDAGLVNAVHPPEELVPAATALAREIVDAAAPVSVALNRQLLWRMMGADHPMAANIVESRAMYQRGLSPDSTEGVGSFLERRPATFTETVPADLPEIFGDYDEPPFTT